MAAAWCSILALVAWCTASAFAAEPQSRPVSAQALELLAQLEKSKDFPSLTPNQQQARERIRDEVAKWRDENQSEQGVFLGDGYGAGVKPDTEALEAAIGKAGRETTEELKPLSKARPPFLSPTARVIQPVSIQPFVMRWNKTNQFVGYALADKDAKGRFKAIGLVDELTGRPMRGKVKWYGSIGFGFTKSAFGERLAVIMTTGATNPAPKLIPRTVDWDEAVALIRGASIENVAQFHNLQVWMTDRDGWHYRTREPKIDAVVSLVLELDPDHKKIRIGTE